MVQKQAVGHGSFCVVSPIFSLIDNGLMMPGQILNKYRIRHRIVIIPHGKMFRELIVQLITKTLNNLLCLKITWESVS
jgi:hypothetical protein